MEEYKKGRLDGQNSVKKTMIFTTLLSVVGIVFIYNNKPIRSLFKEKSDEYFDGYYKGVMERRWGYWFLGWILFLPLFIIVNLINS
jgi:hypothetical protein